MPCEIVNFGNCRLEGVSVLKSTIAHKFSKFSKIQFFGKIENGFFWWNLWNFSKTQKNGWFYLCCVSNEIIAYENSEQSKKFLPGAEDDSIRYKTLIFFKTVNRGLSLLECVSKVFVFYGFRKRSIFVFFWENLLFFFEKIGFFQSRQKWPIFSRLRLKKFFSKHSSKNSKFGVFLENYTFFSKKNLVKMLHLATFVHKSTQNVILLKMSENENKMGFFGKKDLFFFAKIHTTFLKPLKVAYFI